MSNIAPYNEKRKKEKEKKVGGGGGGGTNNKPKRAINETQTEMREEKEKELKKSTHVADSVTVSMSGVFSLPFVSATVLHSGHTDIAITH